MKSIMMLTAACVSLMSTNVFSQGIASPFYSNSNSIQRVPVDNRSYYTPAPASRQLVPAYVAPVSRNYNSSLPSGNCPGGVCRPTYNINPVSSPYGACQNGCCATGNCQNGVCSAAGCPNGVCRPATIGSAYQQGAVYRPSFVQPTSYRPSVYQPSPATRRLNYQAYPAANRMMPISTYRPGWPFRN